MIRMISGWTMRGGGRGLFARNQSVHSITEIIVPDGARLPKLMRGELKVKEVEKEL